MIESLRIKNIATYDVAGIEINDLKKINFIYGSNGSGKTTFTKYIYTPGDKAFNQCSLIWKNGLPINALVYNKDFRDRNFGNGNIDGVFTLGQATKEDIAVIDEKKTERQKIKEKGVEKAATLEKQKELKLQRDLEFRDDVWVSIYKRNENEFKEAFKGFMIKDSFKTKLLTENKNNKSELLTYDQLKELAKTIFGDVPQVLAKILGVVYEELVIIQDNGVWKRKIVGKADVEIAKLIQRLNINDWVNQGRSYLAEDKICPFCQNETITEGFISQLESYFDESFLTETLAVKTLTEEYNRLALNTVNILQQIEQREKSSKVSKLNLELFSAFLNTLNSQFITNRELLNNKIKEPSRSIELVSVNEQLEGIAELIADANTEIESHNVIVANFAKEKSALINRVWRYIIENNKIKIETFTKDQAGLQAGIDALTTNLESFRTQHSEINKEIIRLSKNVTSIQSSIDQINSTLSSYGFHNFSIVPSPIEKNKYQIQRADGTLANSTLSEGEITFITFLYFLQITKGSIQEDNISEERILVIDDPISSLDSNVLFVISSMVKQIIKAIKSNEGIIKQLILLTHNVYFHKEVSFIDGRNQDCKDTYYWILRRNNNVSSIQCFGHKNPIQSSYEILWMELKNRNNSSGLTIQNTMRRIIENYFKLLGKYGDDKLIAKFSNTQEQEICRSLLCWINDGSHTIPDDIFIERQDDTIDKYFEVFQNIFVHTNHHEHFKMMMGDTNMN
jgi:wobble nucleotide-excising tRNase